LRVAEESHQLPVDVEPTAHRVEVVLEEEADVSIESIPPGESAGESDLLAAVARQQLRRRGHGVLEQGVGFGVLPVKMPVGQRPALALERLEVNRSVGVLPQLPVARPGEVEPGAAKAHRLG
jgi:hypothetical protein